MMTGASPKGRRSAPPKLAQAPLRALTGMARSVFPFSARWRLSALESMWSPAVAAIQAEGVPCVYAFPKEGMRGWHGGLSISTKVKGKQLDQAYEYINWWLAGWP